MLAMRNAGLAVAALTLGYAQAIAVPSECILRSATAVGVPSPTGTAFDQTSEIVAQLDTTSAINSGRFCISADFSRLTALVFN